MNSGKPAERNWLDTLFLAAVLVGLALLFILVINYPFGRDQAIYGVVAQTFFEGDVPYRDAWDFKPPGIFFVFGTAQWLFGKGEMAYRIFEALCWLAMGWGFYRISSRFTDPRAAILSFTIAIYGLVRTGYWHSGQPESIGAVLLTFALLLAITDWPTRFLQFVTWIGVAALFSAAGILKPPLGGGILVCYAFAVADQWREDGFIGFLRVTLAYTIGTLAIVGGCIGFYVLTGGWDALVQTLFVFAPQYTGLDHSQLTFFEAFTRAFWLLAAWWFMIPLGFVMFFVFTRIDRQMTRFLILLAGTVLFIMIGVAIQEKFFEYHFVTAVALLALPAGWGFWEFWLRIRGKWWAILLAAAVFGVMLIKVPKDEHFAWHNSMRVKAILDPARAVETRDKLYSNGSSDFRANRETAAWLAENVPQGTDATLFVWGFEPILYYWSGIEPYHRYIYNIAMRADWSKEEARAEFLDGFETAPPWAIVVQSNDILPNVSGNRLSSRDALERDFPELVTILKDRYQPAAQFGPLEVFTLKE
ncbi:glycosyltransferase family 39 protein [Rhodobacteraceae bacterium NNCM2]|nr:glycosyltransferase family 39 protein [Coraliihabitans acroporae]